MNEDKLNVRSAHALQLLIVFRFDCTRSGDNSDFSSDFSNTVCSDAQSRSAFMTGFFTATTMSKATDTGISVF